MRVLVKYVVYNVKKANYLNKIFIRNLTRAATEDHVTVLNENTLTGRILIYLNNEEEKEKSTSLYNKIQLLELFKDSGAQNLRKFTTNDVINLLSSVETQEYVQNKSDFSKILGILDLEYCMRLNNFTNKDIIKLLKVYMTLVSNRITEFKFYKAAICHLLRQVEILPKSDLIQLMFYIGLLKSSPKSALKIRKCIKALNQNYISNLNTEELCIICNSTFKTSTKIINKPFLEKVTTYINDNLILLKDPAVFITLLKTIRHNRCQNDDLLETISCAMFFNETIDCYSFPALCHILALYSDYLYYDESVLNVFSKKCLEKLKISKFVSKHTHLEESLRGKDIKRFLWSLSNLNYNLSKDDIKDIVIPKLIERIEAFEFDGDPSSIIEIILYLWMMKYKAYELVPFGLTKSNITLLQGAESWAKHRLNLLLTCIFFEDRQLFRKLEVQPANNLEYNTSFQLRKRPYLLRVMDNLKPIAAKSDFKFELNCQVPSLNIIGITGYQKKLYKAVNIEVLDDYTCVKKKESWTSGLMQLKLRILDGSEEALIVIDAQQMENMTEYELQQYLQEEIEIVC